MDRLPLSVNKSNLLRLKEEVSFARAGLSLLDEKKEALMSHISSLSTKVERVRTQLNGRLREAYERLGEAVLTHGRLACERASLAGKADENVDVREKSFMGVVLPIVQIRLPDVSPSFGFNETGPTMDSVVKSIHRCMEGIAELAEIETGLVRLSAETKKTIKRINALENVYVPRYEATIKHIEDSLEEKEREFLFQLKRQKRRREGADDERF